MRILNVIREITKTFKKTNLNTKNNTHTHTKQEHSHDKNFKKTTDNKGFLMEIEATCE